MGRLTLGHWGRRSGVAFATTKVAQRQRLHPRTSKFLCRCLCLCPFPLRRNLSHRIVMLGLEIGKGIGPMKRSYGVAGMAGTAVPIRERHLCPTIAQKAPENGIWDGRSARRTGAAPMGPASVAHLDGRRRRWRTTATPGLASGKPNGHKRNDSFVA